MRIKFCVVYNLLIVLPHCDNGISDNQKIPRCEIRRTYMAEKSSLRKTVATVVLTSALVLLVAVGATVGRAFKKTSEDTSSNVDSNLPNPNQPDEDFKAMDIENVEKTGSYGLIDEYTIVYEDGTVSKFIVVNGEDGAEAFQPFPNDNGFVPTVRVGENGNWIVNEKDTGVVADTTRITTDPTTVHIGDDGHWYIGDVDTGSVAQGEPGTTPHIDPVTGNWFIGDEDTGVRAEGHDGKTPVIGANGNWWIGGTDTGVQASGGGSGGGQAGENGKSAYELAVENGFTGTVEEWLLSLVGPAGVGENGKSAYEVYCDSNEGDDLSESDWLLSLVGSSGNGISSIEGPETDGLYDTYTIHYSNSADTTFVVKNGQDGQDGSLTLFGNAEPDALQGRNGDSYINTQTWDYYVKEDNAWVEKGNLKGAQGLVGEAGKSIYAAEGAPSAELGNPGDSYVNVTNGDYYLKGNEGWGEAIGSLKGATGEAGNGIASIELSDDTDPTKTIYTLTYTNGDSDELEIAKPRSIVSIVRTNGNGEAGTVDTYTITYNYGDADTFTVTNGADGNTILTGETAPSDELGRQGDVYVDYVNLDIYLKGADAWSPGVSFKGDDGRGIAGIEKTNTEGLVDTYTITFSDNSTPFVFTVTNGAAGADGTKVVTGNGAPTVLTGFQENDAYIDSTTWNYYVLTDNGTELEWDLRGNIRGTSVTTANLGQNVVPSETTGYKVGDSLINLDDWNYYVLEKDTNDNLVWTLKGNIHYSPETYTITFDVNGGNEDNPENQVIYVGCGISKPTDPTMDNYYFQGWYTDDNEKWDFDKYVPTGDVNLTAHWSQFLLDKNGTLIGCSSEDYEVEIPQYVEGQLVTGIGDNVFKNSEYETITMPKSVTFIGKSAFEGCGSLEGVVIPNSVKEIGENAFKGCSYLNYVYFPQGLEYIGEYAFKNCSYLSGFFIPDSVREIGLGAFEGCNNLNSISIPFVGRSNCMNCDYGDYTTDNTLSWLFGNNTSNVPDYLRTVTVTRGTRNDGYDIYLDYSTNDYRITSNAFYGCSNIETIYLAETIEVIDDYAFSGCTNLRNLIYSNSIMLKEIRSSAFEGCTSLASIFIPRNVEYIEACAFMNCTSLEYVYFDENSKISSIGRSAFENCTSLKCFIEPERKLENDSRVYYQQRVFAGCTSMEKLVVNSMESTNAFSGRIVIQLPYFNIVQSNDPGTTIYDLEGYLFYNSATKDVWIYTSGSWQKVYNLLYESPSNATVTMNESGKPNNPSEGDIYIKTFVNNSTHNTQMYHANGRYEIYLDGKWQNRCMYPKTIGFFFGAIDNSVVPESLKTFVCREGDPISYNVAFKNATYLETIELGSIEEPSYYSSEPYTNIIGYQTFAGCTNLKSVNIPNGVKYVESEAFLDCSSLESIAFPTSVTKFHENVLSGCDSLRDVVIPFVGDKATSPTQTAFAYLFDGTDVPESVKTVVILGGTSIASHAFEYCAYIVEISIPNTVTSIGETAFADCSSLKSINLPVNNTYKTISQNTFSGCTNLKGIVIPNQITTIGVNAFRNCKSLSSLEIPASVTAINDMAFYSCNGLRNITFRGENGTVAIGSLAFSDCKYLEKVTNSLAIKSLGNGAFQNCGELTSINLKNCTAVGSYAFYGCYLLTNVVMPTSTSYTSVEASTFQECYSLADIRLSSSVTEIEAYAFSNCYSLKSVDLRNIAYIRESAFYNCYGLETITIDATNCNLVGENAFSGCLNVSRVIARHCQNTGAYQTWVSQRVDNTGGGNAVLANASATSPSSILLSVFAN